VNGFFENKPNGTFGNIPLQSAAMIHENLPAAIEGLSARIVAIRDSL
jgi:hypothetical protein